MNSCPLLIQSKSIRPQITPIYAEAACLICVNLRNLRMVESPQPNEQVAHIQIYLLPSVFKSESNRYRQPNRNRDRIPRSCRDGPAGRLYARRAVSTELRLPRKHLATAIQKQSCPRKTSPLATKSLKFD